MSVPERLPRANEATIPREKLEGYCLNPEHPTGRHKARVFMAILGIGPAEWEYLRDRLLEGVQDSPVVEIRPGPFGDNYAVNVSVDGLNGRTYPVTSVWFIEEDEPPRLCTAYVEVP